MSCSALVHDKLLFLLEMWRNERERVPLRRKAPLPELDIPAEFVAEDAQARGNVSRRAQASEHCWFKSLLLARELLGAELCNEENLLSVMMLLRKEETSIGRNLRFRAIMVKAMNKKHVGFEEYEYICRRLEKDRLLSAQYNLFRPKPAITEPPSKRQRVEHASSQPDSVPAATTHTADDPGK
ncbi:hypothetical protein Tco_0080397 [Tanacetum coccineum]